MDGNGRWAKERHKPRTYGHYAGAERLKEIVRTADGLGIKILSAYAFSTENWKRPITEVSFIMKLLDIYLTNEIENFNQNNVRVLLWQKEKALPAKVLEKNGQRLEKTKSKSWHHFEIGN